MTTPKPLSGCSVLPPLTPVQKPAGATKRESGAKHGARGHGRWHDLNAFADTTMRHLNAGAVKVWLALFRDTKPSGQAKASDSDLAVRTGMSPRSVFNARRKLTSLGLLRTVRKGSLTVGPSVYQVTPVPAEAGFRSATEKRCPKPRKPASDIPEESQNARFTLGGVIAQEQKSGGEA